MACGTTLYTSVAFAAAPGVAPARAWLAGNGAFRAVRIEWLEDVQHWHPGQDMDLGGRRLRRI